MAGMNQDLVAELAAGLRGDESTVSLLQKCLMLGSQLGSGCLREWARHELKGYEPRGFADLGEVPGYRRVPATLCVDAAVPGGVVEGQPIAPISLPNHAREHIAERATLCRTVGELEDLVQFAEETVVLFPPGAQDLVLLLNREGTFNARITRLYWTVDRDAIRNVVTDIRTALAELIGELLAATAHGREPSPAAVDEVVHAVVHGTRDAVAFAGGPRGPGPEDGWWRRWRRRGQ